MKLKLIILPILMLFGYTLQGQFLLVPEATEPVTIDGIISPGEWDDALSDSSIDNLSDGMVDNSDDLSGSVAFKWDSTHLYLLFQIRDDLRFLDSTDGKSLITNTFKDDSIEVYLDINNTKSGNLDESEGRYQFRFIPKVDGEIERIPFTFPIPGFQFAFVGEDSYIMEIAMPWTTLKVSDPKAGNILGFEVALNDDDDGGERDGQLFWNSEQEEDWMDASKWGSILLISSLENLGSNPIISDVPNANVVRVDGQYWVTWPEVEGFQYQLLKSNNVKAWQNDNRPLLTTGSFRYFILSPEDLQDRIFFQLLVSTQD
jgi:hypothetical protein